jgi:hypothetical protein
MRYMMLIYTKEENLDAMSPEEADQTRQGHGHVIAETRKRGMLVAVNPLARTSNATTVRIENGKPLTTDGPCIEIRPLQEIPGVPESILRSPATVAGT